MSRWFRLHDELVDDPKVQCLPDALFKALINLWCITSQNDGVLPSIEAISFKLRMKPQKVEAIMSELRTAGLIVDDDEGTHPHNWGGRQFKSDDPKDSYVYFIGVDWKHSVKIGFSKNPWARVQGLQTSHPGTLAVLAAFRCKAYSEVNLHVVLHPYRKGGEWFELPAEITTLVQGLAATKQNYEELLSQLRSLLRSSATTEAETEQNTDTEKKEDCPKRVRTPYPEAFSKFWKAYPTTQIMSKKVAFAEWQRLSEEDQISAFEAVAPFIAWLKTQKDHPVVHACRFLSQRRFDGFREAPEESDKRDKIAQDMAARGWEWREGKWQQKPTDDLPDRVPDFKSMAAENTKAA